MAEKNEVKAEYAYSQRVKVYRLNDDGKWEDKGTGRVSVEYLERSNAIGLVVIDEEDTTTLLLHRISADDIYQRQEETIISWTDPELATDLALSFQQRLGCAYIWDQICSVQRRIQMRASSESQEGRDELVELVNPQSPINNGGVLDGGDLPAVGLRNLSQIVKIITEASPFQRDRIASLVLRENYIPKLLELFKLCEDLGSMEGLHDLYRIFKGLILLNDGHVLDLLFSDHTIMDVIGALEYDPDSAVRQQYRQFLSNQVVYKEVIPIRDPALRSKIHQSYRIGYIKDVILPRVLDDQTFGSLNSLILFNNVEVVTSLQGDKQFLDDLFAQLRSRDPTTNEWQELVRFLQEFCSLHKQLPPGQRHQSFSALISLGLFDVLTLIQEHDNESIRLNGMDVLLTVLGQDPTAVRAYLVEQHAHKLFGCLVKGITMRSDGGLQATLLEIMRMLLDATNMEANEKNRFLDMFYEEYMDQLMVTLAAGAPAKDSEAEGHSMAFAGADRRGDGVGAAASQAGAGRGSPPPEVLVTICELLCFCVQQHTFRIKYYVLRNNVVEKVLRLTKRRERYLILAALRFLRTCVGLKDDFYLRYLLKNNLFAPVFAAFSSNHARYNMINSAVLELLEFIRKENLRDVVAHIVNNFGHLLDSIDYCDTGKLFRVRHEQNEEAAAHAQKQQQQQQPVQQQATNGLLLRRVGGHVSEAEMGSLPPSSGGKERVGGGHVMRVGVGARRVREERSVEKEEEDYFDRECDEDEEASPSLLHQDEDSVLSGPLFEAIRGEEDEGEDDPMGSAVSILASDRSLSPMSHKQQRRTGSSPGKLTPPRIIINGAFVTGGGRPQPSRSDSPRPALGLVDYDDEEEEGDEPSSAHLSRSPGFKKKMQGQSLKSGSFSSKRTGGSEGGVSRREGSGGPPKKRKSQGSGSPRPGSKSSGGGQFSSSGKLHAHGSPARGEKSRGASGSEGERKWVVSPGSEKHRVGDVGAREYEGKREKSSDGTSRKKKRASGEGGSSGDELEEEAMEAKEDAAARGQGEAVSSGRDSDEAAQASPEVQREISVDSHPVEQDNERHCVTHSSSGSFSTEPCPGKTKAVLDSSLHRDNSLPGEVQQQIASAGAVEEPVTRTADGSAEGKGGEALAGDDRRQMDVDVSSYGDQHTLPAAGPADPGGEASKSAFVQTVASESAARHIDSAAAAAAAEAAVAEMGAAVGGGEADDEVSREETDAKGAEDGDRGNVSPTLAVSADAFGGVASGEGSIAVHLVPEGAASGELTTVR